MRKVGNIIPAVTYMRDICKQNKKSQEKTVLKLSPAAARKEGKEIQVNNDTIPLKQLMIFFSVGDTVNMFANSNQAICFYSRADRR